MTSSRSVNYVILVESKEMPRNALPSSTSGISSFKWGRPVSAAQTPPSGRSQTALRPDCKQTFALFSEGARGWNIRPHRQCIKCYRRRRVKRSGASPRVDANPPPTSEMGAVFAQVSSLNASHGDNRQSPRVADAAEIVAVVETVARTCCAPLTSWPMRPTTSSLRPGQ